MNKEIISSREALSSLVIYTLGSSVFMAPWKDAGRDGWISILIALAMIVPMLYVYSKIVCIYPDKDFFDILQIVFGKILGNILTLLLIWYSFHLTVLVNRNSSEFIQVMSFPETPIYIFAFIGGILSIWIVKEGIEVIGRFSSFVFPMIILAFAMVGLLLLPKLDSSNLQPILYNGLAPVFKGAVNTFAFPLTETSLFIFVFSSLKDKKESLKTYMYGLLITGIILVTTAARNISALGESLNSSEYFPSYIAAAIINIKEFIDRFEVVVGITFILVGFVKTSICLYFTCAGFAKVFNIRDYRQIVVPIGLTMTVTTVFIYKNTMEMFEWSSENYVYYVIPFCIVIPLVTLLFSRFKPKTNKNSS